MRKFLLLIVLVAISLGLRLYHLDNRGLITDEKFSLITANGFWVGGANQSAFKKEYFTAADFWEKKNLQDYFDATAHSDFGTHIIHNGVLHYWMKLFGNSDYSIRLPSVIFNVLTVILIFLMVLKYFKNYWMAFLAALLFAVDPLNVAQSHIARSYPLSFLLILLSTEYFIKVVKGEGKFSKNIVIYALLIALSLVNHYFNFFIPLIHAIIFFFLRNKSHLWKGFIAAAIFNVLVLVFWFNWGGGYTALDFLSNKNEIHKQIANNGADDLSQVIQKATPELIIKRSIGLFYDIGVLGHGLYDKIRGVKVFLGSIGLFLSLLFFINYNKSTLIKLGSLLIASTILFYFRDLWLGILASSGIFFIIFYALKEAKADYFIEEQKGAFILLATGILMLFLPILFVINDAFNSGTTTSLTHRYIGNASPFVVIIIAVGMVRASEYSKLLGMGLILLCFVQFSSIKKGITDYYQDKSLYNAYFVPQRVKNPYITVAKKLELLAVPGDTIIIPGAYKDKYQERFEKDLTVSFKDAQFLNVYLPQSFKVVQHIDKNEREKLYLKKANGEKILIFDFKGEQFRY